MKRAVYIISAFVIIFLQLPLLHVCASEISRADSLQKAKKHFSFAVQYKKSKNYEEALKNYETSIAYNDTVYQVHYSFADLLMKINNTAYAKREFLTAFKLNPNHHKSAAMLSRFYHESAVYDSALVMYEAMYRLQPEQLSILSSIASLREYLHMDKEALDAYIELVNKGEVLYGQLMRASKLAASLDKIELAGYFAAKALEKRPDDSTALKAAVKAFLALDDTCSAVAYLRKFALADSSDITALVQLESISRAQGDVQQLIWALSKHHQRSPKDTVLIGELAELLFREGKKAEGVACVRKGLEVSPGDGKLRILLGDYYLKQGETEKALEEFKIALKDKKWRSSARQFIWKIEKPETDSEKAEREFFNRDNSMKQ